MKESSAKMEKIPSTMVLHKNVDWADTIFYTTSGPLAKHLLKKWLGVIIIGTYQTASGDIRWAYEPVSDLCPYYSLIVTPVVMGQVTKKSNTGRIRMVSNESNWYHSHAVNQGDLYWVKKGH